MAKEPSSVTMFPLVHLNGTSGEELFRQAADACAAVRRALEKLHEMRPHGRDYYPQGTAALHAAEIEHAERVGALKGVLKELEEIAENVRDQIDAREEGRK